MKIGILTFHASHNFGSMLQNYALQQFLMSEGHIVETINLRNDRQSYVYNFPLHIGSSCPTLRALFGRFKDPKWLVMECRRWCTFERFLKKQLVLTKEYKDWETIQKDLPQNNYDAIIVGGDQIWNTFCYDFDKSYFLPGNIRPTKKVAFSPSFGNEIPRTKKDGIRVSKIKEFLMDFDYISVREKDASDYLQEQLNRDVPVVADPTFIVNPSVYLKIIKEPIVKEPYIYYYTPSHLPDYEAEDIAIELANRLNLKIVTSYPRFREKNRMMSVLSGPSEFLNLLSNAQIVMGKSYHLVIFSILFHKTFITLKRKNDARVKSLLSQLMIGDRNMDSIDDYKHLKDIDYSVVDKELLKIRQKAISYLNDALLQK